MIINGFPRRVLNLRNDCRNDVVVRLLTNSRWSALVTAQVNKRNQTSVDDELDPVIFRMTYSEPAQSTPVIANASAWVTRKGGSGGARAAVYGRPSSRLNGTLS